MSKVLVMILAGGRGNRMKVLCHNRPKPVLPIAGMFRVIDFSLSNSVNSGLHNIAVLIDYQRRCLREYLGSGEPWGLDRRGKMEILEPRSGSYKGTADAVYQNLSYIQECGANLVLILPADQVYKMDYSCMIAFHEQVKAEVTVAVTSVPIEEAHRFGLASIDQTNRIQGFVEKPKIPQSNLASMGIYLFDTKALVRRLTEDAQDSSSSHDFGYAVIPRMVHLDKAFAYKFEGYWQDIGTVESYYQSNMMLVEGSPSFSLDDTWPIFTRKDGLAEGTTSNQVKNSLVSSGCVIEGRVENSVLSPGVRIEPEALVRKSVIMSNCVIGRHSVIDHCILDEGVNIGEFSYVGFGASLVPGSLGITVVGRGATIPSHTAIGRNCKIYPGIEPTAFRTEVVPPGTLVSPGESSSISELHAIGRRTKS